MKQRLRRSIEMNVFKVRAALSVATAGATVFLLAAVTAAGGVSQTPKVTGVWARATVGSTAAVYLTMTGTGKADRLVSAAVPRSVARRTELHKTTMGQGDMMSMAPVKSIRVPAAGTVKLEPGGYHVMLIGLKKPLVAGSSFHLALTFANSGTTTVTAKVRKN